MLLFTFGVLGVVALAGCKGFHPVGPLAKKAPVTQQGKELPKSPDPSDSSRAGKTTPPTTLVQPGDVTATNTNEVAAKLAAELNTDSKSPTNGPVTVEVSRPKVK
jgi:hypothetical protein